MVNQTRRFLALNAMLNGRSALEAFDNSEEKMASATGFDISDIKGLADTVYNLPKKELPCSTLLANVFLNFFRTPDYAFLTAPGVVYPFEEFVKADLEGQVTNELRENFLFCILSDVAYDEKSAYPYIEDGVVYCKQKDATSIGDAIFEAYNTILKGPAKTQKSLATSIRKYSSMDSYSPITGKMLIKIMRQFIQVGLNPIIYNQTLVHVPDYFEIYNLSGAVISYTNSDPLMPTVQWLVDVEGSDENATCVFVELDRLHSLITKDIKALSNARIPSGARSFERVIL